MTQMHDDSRTTALMLASQFAEDMPIAVNLIRHVLWEMRQAIVRGGRIAVCDDLTIWEQKITWIFDAVEEPGAAAQRACREAGFPRVPA